MSLGEVIAVTLPVLAVYGQMTLLGANSAFLSAAAALCDIAVALIVLLLVGGRAPRGLWIGLAAAAAFLLAALGWGALGLLPFGRSDWTAAYLAPHDAGVLSIAPDRTLLELSKLLGAAALAVAAALAASSPKRLRLSVQVLLVVGTLHTLLSLTLFAIDPNTVAGYSKGWHQWRLTGTLLNGNAFATSLAMTAALAAAYFRIELRRLQRAPSGARSDGFIRVGATGMLLFLLAGACALTVSRTALAVLGLAVIAVIFWPSHADREEPAMRKGRWRQAGWGLLAAAACVGLAIALTGGATLDRLSSIEGDLPTRLDAYRLFLARVAAAPLNGYGLGAFALVATPGIDLDLGMKIWNMGAAHNAWLQAAMEGGVPYAVLLTLAALAMAAPALLRPAATPSERALRMGAGAALFVVVACASVDIALNVPAVAAQAMVMLGLFTGAAYSQHRPIRRAGRTARPEGDLDAAQG